MNKEVLIITAINPTKAYSCVKYLFDSLIQSKNVALWALVPEDSIDEYKKWGKTVYSFANNVFGKIPKIRMIAMKIIGFFLCLEYRNKTIICHETYHYHSACIVKRLFPNTKLVHYCTEMYNDKSAKFQQWQLRYYKRHCNDPDLIIECNKEREAYRKKLYNIKKPQVVIENTIPKCVIAKYQSANKKYNLIPEIVYSGGCHGERDLDIIVDALKLLDFDYSATFIVYGPKSSINLLKEKCATIRNRNINIITGLTREKVLPYVAKADIGIVYYDPDYSMNCKYAAPTKFFEYMGLFVPVVSSRNESLVRIIDKYKIGRYMKLNNAVGMAEEIKALKEVRQRELIGKNEMIAFHNHLCYERQSIEALDKLEKLIAGVFDGKDN